MDVKTTDSGDFEIVNNNIVLVTSSDEVRQKVLQNLRTFRGEWFLDTTIGVPWFQSILKKRPVPSVVESLIKLEILNTIGVIELLKFDATLNSSRQLEIDFTLRSQQGEIQISEVIG